MMRVRCGGNQARRTAPPLTAVEVDLLRRHPEIAAEFARFDAEVTAAVDVMETASRKRIAALLTRAREEDGRR